MFPEAYTNFGNHLEEGELMVITELPRLKMERKAG